MKADLPKLLEKIHSNLNSSGECIILKIANLEHSSLFLKLIKNHIDPQLVQSFEVPMFTVNHDSIEIDDWDLATQKVSAHMRRHIFVLIYFILNLCKIIFCINGFKTVSMIANETDIEISVVKEAIQNLL